jgi:hypothetical protein
VNVPLILQNREGEKMSYREMTRAILTSQMICTSQMIRTSQMTKYGEIDTKVW